MLEAASFFIPRPEYPVTSSLFDQNTFTVKKLVGLLLLFPRTQELNTTNV